jgi:hypothetical protein
VFADVLQAWTRGEMRDDAQPDNWTVEPDGERYRHAMTSVEADERIWVQAVDGSLVVLPVLQAEADAQTISTLLNASCVGDLRKDDEAWAIARYWLPAEEITGDPDASADALTDDVPFSAEAYLEGMVLSPLAQTEKYCPQPILAEFGVSTFDSTYTPGDLPDTVLSEADQAGIESRLRELGYTVTHNPDLLDGYLQ